MTSETKVQRYYTLKSVTAPCSVADFDEIIFKCKFESCGQVANVLVTSIWFQLLVPMLVLAHSCCQSWQHAAGFLSCSGTSIQKILAAHFALLSLIFFRIIARSQCWTSICSEDQVNFFCPSCINRFSPNLLLHAVPCCVFLPIEIHLNNIPDLCESRCRGVESPLRSLPTAPSAEKGGNPDLIRESQRRRYADVSLVDKIIDLDKQWRDGRSPTCSLCFL